MTDISQPEKVRNLNAEFEAQRQAAAAAEQPKPATRAARQTLQAASDAMVEKQAKLTSDYAAERERLRMELEAIRMVEEPLNAMLRQRQELLERIGAARVQYGRQTELQKEWLGLMDLAIGNPHESVRDVVDPNAINAHSQITRCPNLANAERIAREIEGFIPRREAELGNLEAQIQAYASQHGLRDMLPADMVKSS